MTQSKQRAISYTRLASETQANAGGTSAQEQMIIQHCQEKGYQMVDSINDVGTISAVESLLPGLEKAVKKASNGDFDILVVSTMDRLSREIATVANIVTLFAQYDVLVEAVEIPDEIEDEEEDLI